MWRGHHLFLSRVVPGLFGTFGNAGSHARRSCTVVTGNENEPSVLHQSFGRISLGFVLQRQNSTILTKQKRMVASSALDDLTTCLATTLSRETLLMVAKVSPHSGGVEGSGRIAWQILMRATSMMWRALRNEDLSRLGSYRISNHPRSARGA